MSSIAELNEREQRLRAELTDVTRRHNASSDDHERKGLRERHGNLQRAISACRAEAHAAVLTAAERPDATIPGDLIGGEPGNPKLARRQGRRPAGPDPSAAQTAAIRAIEHQASEGVLDTTSADRLAGLVDRDLHGLDSGYLAAVADELYERAFARVLLHGPAASLRMEADEADAMRTALRAEELRASFGGGGFSAGPVTVGGGSLPLPLSVDPTIVPTSPGVVSPIRDAARIVQVTTSSYKLGTSQGMSAAFVAEGTEVDDNTPTIDPIEITPQRAQAFAEFSIEASQDWTSIQSNLTSMLADAKALLEGEKFLDGAGEGSNEPEGLLTGGTVVVSTAATAVLAVPDLIATQDDLPARYQPNSAWYGSLSVRNDLDQLVAQADPSQAKITDDAGNVLRRPYRETSQLATAIASNNKILVYGDLAQAYRIVDRIGMTIEIVPHIFGSNRRPLGLRGLLAMWRTSAAVVNADAVRVLKVR